MITVITNGRLLDCIGDEPLEDASVIIEDGVIREVYSRKKAAPKGATVIDAGGKTVMPGLTDAHAHVSCTHLNPEKDRTEPPLYKAVGMNNNLERMLQSGFTTVRDMGGTHWSLRQAVEDGIIKGPRLLISCSYLSPTGGHGDESSHGEQLYYDDLERLRKSARLCDGVDDCRRATREQHRNGADQIKIMATGGCYSPNDEPWHLQFCEAEIEAIVEEAKAVGKYVAAHCEEDAGMRRAVECGVRTVEHGSFMKEETARLMKAKGVYHVPTLAVIWWLMTYGKELGAPDFALRKIKEPLGPGKPDMLESQIIAMQLTKKIGVPVGSGSDYICSEMIGNEAMELKLRVDVGAMTPYEAIKSATIVNAEIMRLKNKIGSIEVGKWADIIAVDGQPDEDALILTDPDNVRLVIKRGNIFKNTL